jgi:hypothetical protein
LSQVLSLEDSCKQTHNFNYNKKVIYSFQISITLEKQSLYDFKTQLPTLKSAYDTVTGANLCQGYMYEEN